MNKTRAAIHQAIHIEREMAEAGIIMPKDYLCDFVMWFYLEQSEHRFYHMHIARYFNDRLKDEHVDSRLPKVVAQINKHYLYGYYYYPNSKTQKSHEKEEHN